MAENRPTPTTSTTDDGDEESRGFGAIFDRRSSEHPPSLNTESVDHLDENLHDNDQSRATGFLGQNSDVQWLRSFILMERAQIDTVTPGRMSSAYATNSGQVSTVTYYLDHESIDIGFQVDPYGIPALDVAEPLVSLYMEKVHESFPILPRKLFENQCQKYFDSLRYGSAPRLNTKWQAILNLIFAIGATYSHLIKVSWQADERDHSIYRARAQALAVNEISLQQHPDLPQIQVLGLLAFYYLSVGQISR